MLEWSMIVLVAVVVPPGSELVNVIGDLAGVLPFKSPSTNTNVK
jgi:hypothetical protein